MEQIYTSLAHSWVLLMIVPERPALLLWLCVGFRFVNDRLELLF